MKAILFLIFLTSSLHLIAEKLEDFPSIERIYIHKKIVSPITIKKKKIFGMVTSLIPFTVFIGGNMAIWSNIFEKDEMDYKEDNRVKINVFFSALTGIVTVLASLIPIHYFMQARVEEEYLKSKASFSKKTNSFVKKYTDKIRACL